MGRGGGHARELKPTRGPHATAAYLPEGRVSSLACAVSSIAYRKSAFQRQSRNHNLTLDKTIYIIYMPDCHFGTALFRYKILFAKSLIYFLRIYQQGRKSTCFPQKPSRSTRARHNQYLYMSSEIERCWVRFPRHSLRHALGSNGTVSRTKELLTLAAR